MKKVTELYLTVVAIFISSFSDTLKDFVLEIKEFSLETDEFLNG